MFRTRKPSRGVILGDEFFEYEPVGEASYQREIESIVGGKTDESVEKYVAALLTPEPSNPHDKFAVKVSIRGLKVAYVRREDCAAFHKALRRGGFTEAACEALIVGGWRRRNGDEGHFGIKLNALFPFEIVSPEAYKKEQAEPKASPVHSALQPERKRTLGRRGWLALILLVIFGYAYFQKPAEQPKEPQKVASVAPVLTEEEQAAAAKKKAEEAKREAEYQMNISAVRQVKAAMKNPDSFKLEEAIRMDDGTLCISYRGTNSFNAIVPGQAVITKTRIFTSDSSDTFSTNWRRYCQGKSGQNVISIRWSL